MKPSEQHGQWGTRIDACAGLSAVLYVRWVEWPSGGDWLPSAENGERRENAENHHPHGPLCQDD